MGFNSAWYIELRGSADHDVWIDTASVDAAIARVPGWRIERVADRRVLHHAGGTVDLICAAADKNGNYAQGETPQQASLVTFICWGHQHEAACRVLAKELADALRWEVVPEPDEAL
jgi:hypothetical protein